MTDFQKAVQAVQSIGFQLDLVGQKLAHEPRTGYEAQNTYHCALEELNGIGAKLRDGASLPLKVKGFVEKAEETDPSKQLYGEAMRAKVRSLATELEALRVRADDMQMILDATHAAWEETRIREEEAARREEARVAAEREREQEEKRRLQALREEEERQRDLETCRRLEEQAAERKRREQEKKRAKAQKRRERDREEKLLLQKQMEEKEAAKREEEKWLEARLQAQAEEAAAHPETRGPEAPAEAPKPALAVREELYTLPTLPGDLYGYTYEARPIAKSPKAELVIVAPPSAVDRCHRLVLWRVVLLACAPRTTNAVTFEYKTPASVEKEATPANGDDSDAEDDDGSQSSGSPSDPEAAESNPRGACEEPDVTSLAAFLAAQWEQQQEDSVGDTVYGRRLPLDWMRDPSRLQWLVLLSHGGYFAAAVFVGGKPTIHKAFHRYITRRGQGGRQSTHDSGGGSQSSVGSQLRRHHEAKWKEQIQATLTEWAPHLRPCSGLFLHAPGPHNARVLYFEGGPLAKGDPRIQSIPFTTGRPSFEEVRRSYSLLSAVVMECHRTSSGPTSRGALHA